MKYTSPSGTNKYAMVKVTEINFFFMFGMKIT